jgi:ATP-binding cassette subfamily G (WHITE) protein 2 (PDR)
VLYEGRQIYFGRVEDAKAYFTEMGYWCPDRQTTGDFLTSLTNPGERVVKRGFESLVPRTPDEFANVWRHSETRKALLRDIADFEEEFPINGPQLVKFTASRKAQQPSLMFDIYPKVIQDLPY